MKPFEPRLLPLNFIEWDVLFEQTVKANRALARFEGTLEGVLNPGVLLSPMTTNEAVLSSRIEGTQATLGDVLRYEAGDEPTVEARRIDIHEIINYRTALFNAQDELKKRPFSLNLLKQLHEILLNSVRGRNKSRGLFRKEQNWIGRDKCTIDEADFVPPVASEIDSLLWNWEEYYHFKEKDLLVQLAIIHAQFEIIHPFIDGNGRLGRILIPLFLYEKGLLKEPMFYISSYFEANREEYIRRLRKIDNSREAWTSWILFFLHAVEEQARKNADTARRIIALYNDMKIRILSITRSQFAVPLLDEMFYRPIFSSNKINLAGNQPSSVTISNMLRSLKEEGILQVIREGRGRTPQILALGELVSLADQS